MSFDVAKLTAPIDEASPAGEDVEYDPIFLKLDELSTGIPSKEMGDSVVQGTDPNWKELRKSCLALFERTRDLRVAVYLTLAGLCVDGLGEMRDGLLVVKGLLENFWPTMWPALDPDDDNDPTERMNTLGSLSPKPGAFQDPVMFVQRLRSVPLCHSPRMGTFSLRDILVANGDLAVPGDAEEPEMSVIDAAFMDTDRQILTNNQAMVAETIKVLGDIAAILAEKVGSGDIPTFEALLADLRRMDAVFQKNSGGAAADSADTAAGNGGDLAPAATGANSARSPITGEIRGRDDALALMERVCKYFERAEPNSPIPFMLRRAVKVAKMDFISLVNEMTPDALEAAKGVLGLRGQPDSEG